MYTDLYLKFPDQATAVNVLYNEKLESYLPVMVTDETLAAHLDTLPLRDAQYDQVVDYDGKLWMADLGKWYELTEIVYGYLPKYQNIDVLGILYEGGEWDEDGEVISEPVALEGWHVNVRVVDGEDPGRLEEYEVTPQNPRRIWG
jgi:hypothetical protein